MYALCQHSHSSMHWGISCTPARPTLGHRVGALSAVPSLVRNELLIFCTPGFRWPLSSTRNVIFCLAGACRVEYLVSAVPYCGCRQAEGVQGVAGW
jgi:hypothetical protein